VKIRVLSIAPGMLIRIGIGFPVKVKAVGADVEMDEVRISLV